MGSAERLLKTGRHFGEECTLHDRRNVAVASCHESGRIIVASASAYLTMSEGRHHASADRFVCVIPNRGQ